jgi:hypothetical protein
MGWPAQRMDAWLSWRVGIDEIGRAISPPLTSISSAQKQRDRNHVCLPSLLESVREYRILFRDTTVQTLTTRPSPGSGNFVKARWLLAIAHFYTSCLVSFAQANLFQIMLMNALEVWLGVLASAISFSRTIAAFCQRFNDFGNVLAWAFKKKSAEPERLYARFASGID